MVLGALIGNPIQIEEMWKQYKLDHSFSIPLDDIIMMWKDAMEEASYDMMESPALWTRYFTEKLEATIAVERAQAQSV